MTMFLNEALYSSRHKFLSTNYHTTSYGWPIVLLVMWLLMFHSPVEPGDEEIYRTHVVALREHVYRYFRVCTLEEQPIMQALVRETVDRATSGLGDLVDSDDARMIILALTRRLTIRPNPPTSQTFLCLNFISRYAAFVTRGSVDDLYPGLLRAGLSRLWIECPGNININLDRDTRDRLLDFANMQISQVRCVMFAVACAH